MPITFKDLENEWSLKWFTFILDNPNYFGYVGLLLI